MKRRFLLIFLLFISFPALCAPPPNALPRFASVKSDQVNLRTGPGMRYPINWVLTRRNMPVEILDVFDQWRKIRLQDGDEGWVHQTALSGKRYFVTLGPSTLYKKQSLQSPVAAYLDDGIQMRMVKCPKNKDFCQVDIDGIEGWIERKNLYGIHTYEFTK